MAAAKKVTRATRLPATTRAPPLVPVLLFVRPCENELPLLLEEVELEAAADPEALALESVLSDAVSPRLPPPLTPGTVATSVAELVALDDD